MANDLELALRIRTDMRRAVRELRALRGDVRNIGPAASRSARGMNRLAQTGSRVTSIFRGLSGVIATVGFALLAREVIQADDAYAQIEGRLRLVTDNAQELAQVQGELFDVAQDTRAQFTGTVDLYTRLARSTESLNVSQADLVGLTETINQTMVVSGASTEAAANATFQLSQAFTGGVLRAEEYNSIIDQAPRLIEALADGTGIAMEDFREAVNSGRITAQLMLRALRDQAPAIADEFGLMERTVGQAMQQLTNDLQRASAAGDLSPLVDAIDDVREIVSDPAFIENLGSVLSGLASLTEKVVSVSAALGHLPEALGLKEVDNDFVRVDNALRDVGARLQEVRSQIEGRDQGVAQFLPDALLPSEEELNRRLEQLLGERKGLLAERKRLEEERFRELFPERGGGANDGGATPARPAAPAGEDEETTKARGALEKIRDALRLQVATFDEADAKALEYRLTVGDLADEVAALGPEGEQLAQSIISQSEALGELEASKRAEAAAEEERQRLAEQGLQLTEQLLTAQEIYDAEIERYVRLLSHGAISTETFNRAVAASRDALEQAQDGAEETNDEMSQFAIQAARNMQSAFADFLFDPFDQGIEGMARGFVDVIRRMASEAIAAKLGEALFGDLLSAGGGAGGGNLGAIGGFIASLFHEGGQVGAPGVPKRRVSPLLFAGAPRLHGGLMPGEFPAILDQGESVLTADQTESLARGAAAGSAAGTRIVLVDERQSLSDFMTSAAGERSIVEVVKRNATALSPILK